MPNIGTLTLIAAIMFVVLGGISVLAHIYSLNSIKAKTVGDGQHGTARWARNDEIHRTYKQNASNRLTPIKSEKRSETLTRSIHMLCHILLTYGEINPIFSAQQLRRISSEPIANIFGVNKNQMN